MFVKRFYVRVDLELNAITCPGVWLCSHGYVEVTIKSLGFYFHTGPMAPRFPLLCHNQYTMDGYMKSVKSLQDLEHILLNEKLEITLWQNSRRLAYFIGRIADLMHPTLPRLTCEHNVTIQLLMKATPAFPGIIAPKVELSAKVAVQDRYRNRRSSADSYCSYHCTLDKLKPVQLLLEPKHASKPKANFPLCNELHCSRCQHEEKRKQQQVCHARHIKCLGFSCCPTPTSLSSFEAESLAHKSELRRLSACSSLVSSNSNTLSQTSGLTTSDCCHSTKSGVNMSASAVDFDYHLCCCSICQEYRRVFKHSVN